MVRSRHLCFLKRIVIVTVQSVSITYQDIMTTNVPPFIHRFCQDLIKKKKKQNMLNIL